MPVDTTDTSINSKTPGASDTTTASPALEEIVVKAKRDINVLNKFRSYTYNFTLASISKEQVNRPESYRGTGLVKNVILRSGGKAGSGITSPQPATQDQIDGITRQHAANILADNSTSTSISADTRAVNEGLSRQLTLLKDGPQVVNDYNASTWAKFDYYIDNVELKTIMAPSRQAQATIVSGMSFEIFEPFSISGFLETLQVAAVAAGYINYMQAVFVLEIKFIGYPDGVGLPAPTIVEKSTRFIPFRFSKIEVDVSEQGTRYRCQGVAVDQQAFGKPNNLIRAIQVDSKSTADGVKDSSVLAVLQNLMNSINNGIGLDSKDGKYVEDTTCKPAITNDEYKILFPVYEDGKLNREKINPIANAIVTEIFLEKAIYDFVDPVASKGSNYKFYDEEGATDTNTQVNPSSTKMVFSPGANVSEIISSVIRDSDYLTNILKNISEGNPEEVIDENDMIDFWRITLQVEIGDYDPVFGRNKHTYTFVVTPYKIHYTEIPGLMKDSTDPAKLAKLIRREYNYIYSGLNVDVLNFKLNLNTLFYEPLVRAMGNSGIVPSADALSPGDQNEIKQKEKKQRTELLTHKFGKASSVVEVLAEKVNQKNAGAPKSNPFSIQAKNMFRSVLETSQYSMLKGDLEIIGDPFYLVTGGLGNYFPDLSPENPAETSDGETNYNYGQVLLKFNFKNPRDIDSTPFSNGGTGLAQFEIDKISFTGIYRVNQVTSIFREGVFKQRLEINRLITVNDDESEKVDSPVDNFQVSPNPNDVLVPDAAQNLVKTPPASSISQLISGIQKIETSIQTAVSRIEGAIGGAITAAGQAVSDVVSLPGKVATSAINTINGKIQGIAAPITDAASKLGLTTAELLTLKPDQLAALIALSKLVPPNSEVVQQLKNGVVIQSPADLKNLPAANPPTEPIPDGITINGKKYSLEDIQKIRDASAQSDIPIYTYFGLSSSSSSSLPRSLQ